MAVSEQASLLPFTANATLRAQGTPPVQSLIFSATKEVQGGMVGPCSEGWAGRGSTNHS